MLFTFLKQSDQPSFHKRNFHFGNESKKTAYNLRPRRCQEHNYSITPSLTDTFSIKTTRNFENFAVFDKHIEPQRWISAYTQNNKTVHKTEKKKFCHDIIRKQQN